MDTKSLFKTRKPYAKPIMLAERFVAYEFVAACSVQGAPLGGGGYYLYDSGTNTGWVDNNDEKFPMNKTTTITKRRKKKKEKITLKIKFI